ncbi:hypothetical protein BC628DRAFT_665185 [Trametes gibbosa]|nr:hypothetical protein BC628DRAFT_665185 [Trametes gibbosa]
MLVNGGGGVRLSPPHTPATARTSRRTTTTTRPPPSPAKPALAQSGSRSGVAHQDRSLESRDRHGSPPSLSLTLESAPAGGRRHEINICMRAATTISSAAAARLTLGRTDRYRLTPFPFPFPPAPPRLSPGCVYVCVLSRELQHRFAPSIKSPAAAGLGSDTQLFRRGRCPLLPPLGASCRGTSLGGDNNNRRFGARCIASLHRLIARSGALTRCSPPAAQRSAPKGRRSTAGC